MTESVFKCINGLSDAEITDIKKENFEYDYKQKNPIRNVLEIVFNAELAMLATSVKSLRFYNYKIINENINFIHSWWQESEFVEINGKTGLKISFRSSKTNINELIILFDKIEVIRNN